MFDYAFLLRPRTLRVWHVCGGVTVVSRGILLIGNSCCPSRAAEVLGLGGGSSNIPRTHGWLSACFIISDDIRRDPWFLLHTGESLGSLALASLERASWLGGSGRPAHSDLVSAWIRRRSSCRVQQLGRRRRDRNLTLPGHVGERSFFNSTAC